jgi:hypothetical protein
VYFKTLENKNSIDPGNPYELWKTSFVFLNRLLAEDCFEIFAAFEQQAFDYPVYILLTDY